ncbi:MAG: rod shape-determining protein MreD [Alphaproteobacteria bacterium]|nr:rod shape-determining protein MreD [Alphaproteobacteria bacterium SS10]
MAETFVDFHPLRLLGRLLPSLTLAFMVVLGLMLPANPWTGQSMPPLLLMAVFVWAVYRPEFLPLPVVFGFGVIFDALLGLPLGISAVLLVAIYWPVTLQRRIFLREPFPFLWLAFAVILSVVELLRWVLVAALTLELPPIGLVLANIVFGCGIFPIIGWLLIRLNHWIGSLDYAN